MRTHIRAALLTIVRRRKIGAGDAQAWDGISVRDVADEAGVSVGTIYKYFSNRADLGQSLWAEPVEQLREAMRLVIATETEPTACVRALLQHYAAFAVQNRHLFRSAFLFVRSAQAETPAPLLKADEPFFAGLCAALEAGQRSGQFRPLETEATAQMFWAALHGSLALPENLDRYDFDPPSDLSSKMIAMLMDAISRR